ncbi:MAG: ROK family protein [Nocardioides sp.]|uniref:ROK family protein n=1 Tax=Nocardioides sp. TaxID=35761 RepID=UPI003F04C4B1
MDVGVDVGGTTVTAAVVAADGSLVRTVHAATPRPSAGVGVLEDVLVEAVREVSAGVPVARVGLAAAAFVDSHRERAMFAPHLAWRGEPAASTLSARVGAPVLLENDATCAAWGEATTGAAAGSSSSITLTVGTGIGGGVVLDGRLLRGHNGMAGEFGHVCVDPEGPLCPCGGRGCWERYVSATALEDAAERHRGGGAARWIAPQVSEAARAGDPAALAAFEEVGSWLGRGLLGAVAVLDPEVVVIGGGVSAAGDLLLDPARAVLAAEVVGHGHRSVPRLVTASLGPSAGLVGAVLLAREVFPVV